MPAHADHTVVTGVNNGDVGFISLTTASSVGGARSNNPLDALLDAKCEFHQVTRPSSNEAHVVVVGHAGAAPKGTVRAVATSVRCVLKNVFTGAIVVNHVAANEGSVAAAPAYKLSTLATSYVVCAEAKALYADDTYVTTDPLSCIFPF